MRRFDEKCHDDDNDNNNDDDDDDDDNNTNDIDCNNEVLKSIYRHSAVLYWWPIQHLVLLRLFTTH